MAFRLSAVKGRKKNFQHVVARSSRARRQNTTATNRKRKKSEREAYRKHRFIIGTDILHRTNSLLVSPFHSILIPFRLLFSVFLLRPPTESELFHQHEKSRISTAFLAQPNYGAQVKKGRIRYEITLFGPSS
jgi:hypothetical protein